MNNAEYSIEVHPETKEVNIAVSGKFQEEDAQDFVQTYQAEVGAIDPKDYYLILDCKSLVVVSPEILPMLEACYKMYKASEFNKVKFIASSAVVSMQLKRIAHRTELDNAEIVVASN